MSKKSWILIGLDFFCNGSVLESKLLGAFLYRPIYEWIFPRYPGFSLKSKNLHVRLNGH